MSESKAVAIINAIGKCSPINKLLDMIKIGTGKLYEPIHVRRMAKARAEEIKLIGNAIADTAQVPMTYDKGAITANTENADDLAKRAEYRLGYQEIRKQVNIESVMEKSYLLLENQVQEVDCEMDEDWINRFFNSIEDISNEKMQEIWAKVLAGEILKPRTFSLRTLSLLKNLTHKEIMLFNKIANYILSCPSDIYNKYTDYFLPIDALYDNDWFTKTGIVYSDMLVLSDAGLLNCGAGISITFEVKKSGQEYIYGHGAKIQLKNNTTSNIIVNGISYFLTESGKELMRIINPSCDDYYSYLTDVVSWLKSENNEIEFSIIEKTKELKNDEL